MLHLPRLILHRLIRIHSLLRVQTSKFGSLNLIQRLELLILIACRRHYVYAPSIDKLERRRRTKNCLAAISC